MVNSRLLNVSYVKSLIVFFLAVLPVQSFVSSAAADSQQVDFKGTARSVEIPVADKDKKFYFYGFHKGNLSSVFWYQVEVPEGATLKLSYALANPSLKKNIASGGSWINFSSSITKKSSTQSYSIAGLQGLSSSFSSLFKEATACSGIGEEQLSQIKPFLQMLYPDRNWTNEEICKYLLDNGGGTVTPPGTEPPGTDPIGGGNTPTTPNGKVFSNSAILLKDACGKKSDEYAVRIEVDLSKVDAARYPGGKFPLIGKFYSSEYRGCKAASIKPVSDGKFAPQPLILMCTLGGGENVLLNKWNKAKIGKTEKLRVEDYIYYRNNSFTRSVVSKQLRGGKGTFTVANSSNAYGVCFKLDRRRQKANGYQGGD